MQQRILSPTQEAILGIERHWLTQLQIALARFTATPEDRAALEQSVRQLDELFLLVVVGEFNAGKSAFINALFGEELLPEGVTPTTTRVHLLKYGKTFQRVAMETDADVYTVPAPLLREINIVDTPGTNAIHREHETITQEFIPRSDLVLFVTSVDRPFTESERAFLSRIQDWGKKVVVVLNKIDILKASDDITQIEKFISENAQALLGFSPEIFPISSNLALKAKQQGDTELLEQSGLPALERYITKVLDKQERVALKLRNPLGVGLHLIEKYVNILEGRLALLQEDFQVMDNVTRQLATYHKDMEREFSFRLSDVDQILEAFENRGISFFDETMRLIRIIDLLDKAKLEMQFKQQVIADAPQAIEARALSLTEWMVESIQEQWHVVMEQVRRRKEHHAEYILGEVPGAFDIDREGRIESVSRVAQQVLQGYDRGDEARRIAQSLQRSVANTALAEVGAVGLGTIITLIATGTAMDVTGVLAAGTVAVLGLLVIPNRRRQIKRELREKIGQVREHLMGALTTQFEEELDHSLQELDAAISPYTRFIRTQRQHLEETQEEFVKIRKWLERQEEEIAALGEA